MLFLLSGEGPTDLGECNSALPNCDGADYSPGPIALIVAAVVEPVLGYSPLDPGQCQFVPRAELKRVAAELPPRRVRLPGLNRPRETGYYANSARALAAIARALATERGDDVIAVLFRDADTTARQEWYLKWQSMLDGFNAEGLSTGAPLLPQPSSEAWLLCIFGQAVERLAMPSFRASRERLEQVLNDLLRAPGRGDSP